MGAKTWMQVYSKGDPKSILRGAPTLDRDATIAFSRKLFSSEQLEVLDDGALSYTRPPDDEIVAGCFPGLVILAAKKFAIDPPSAHNRQESQEGCQ
jgi:hypothetical protein